jgi:hypothetical protein
MAKNRNRYQTTAKSQRPAHQQASVRPAVSGEAPLDNTRVPSSATTVQSEADAQAADPDRYVSQEPITDTDAFPGQVTDLAGGDDTVNHELAEDELDAVEAAEAEEGAEFVGFADSSEIVDPPARAHKAVVPVEVSLTAQEQFDADHKLVPVMPRRTVMRTNIGGKWWNFFKGQEQFVPAYVREHLSEKGVI